jgi:hypothetical protein
VLTLLLPPFSRLRRDPALCALLDPLLARGDRLEDFPEGRHAQLGCLFGLEPLPAAALSRAAEDPPVRDGLWLRADPAYLMVDMAAVRLMACGELAVADDERNALAADLAELFFAEGLGFEAPSPSRWYLRLPDDTVLPRFHPPELALGADLEDWLPAGPEQGRWRRLLNEAQVVLHNHAVNAARQARGLLPVNSLWFWGAGRLPASATAAYVWIASGDPLLRALAARAGIEAEEGDAAAPGLVDLHAADAPAVAAAVRHAAKDAILIFADGTRYRLAGWQRLRFWRRPSPGGDP